MTRKVFQEGNVLPMVAMEPVKVNDLIVVGKLVGVVLNDAGPDETYQLDLAGVYEVPKSPTVTFSVGDIAYAKGDGVVDDTNTNPVAGHVIEAVGNPSVTVKIRLVSGF